MAVYGKLKVPEFKPWEAKKAQGKYFDLIDETSGQAGAAVQKINDTNQAELTRLMEQSLGPGYAETWGKGMRTLGAQAEGRFTDEQETMYRNIYTAKAQQMGLSGSGAGLNLKVSGLGREGVRMQQQALATMPGFMQGMRQNLMATPTRVESMFIPIQQYAAQSAADNLNVWRQQYAQQQAAHSSSMANTAYQLQREQADEAKAMAVKQQGLAARNAVTARNSAAFASSRSGNPFASGIAGRRRSTFI
jgi:hypothetical protein